MAPTAAAAEATKKQGGVTAQSSYTAQTTDARKITIRLVDVNEHLICKLCSGYFRDALTIKECAHTFCSSCIRRKLARHPRSYVCPTCNANLGAKPLKNLIADPLIQGLVDMLLPDVKQREDEEEREFYKLHGFKRKPGGAATVNVGSGAAKRRRSGPEPVVKRSSNYTPPAQVVEMISFDLVPSRSEMVPLFLQEHELNERAMRTDASTRIHQLCKYVALSLSLPNGDHVEICCKGQTLGREHSLTFVNRTIWRDPGQRMVLEYHRKLA